MTSQYKIYSALSKRLFRAEFRPKGLYGKYGCNGSIASYLCDLFLKLDGVVYKNDLIKYGIFSKYENLTNDFISILVKTNFIKWDMEENIKRGLQRYKVYAAPKLTDLLDKEEGERKATKRDFDLLQKDIENLKRCVKKLISKIDPPATDEKMEAYMEWSKDESEPADI